MAVVSLTQGQAQAQPYVWVFNTKTDKGSVVTAQRRQRGVQREFNGANVAAVLVKINNFETYLSNAGITVSHL